MGKARNLSVLLAADGQVEDAKLDGLTSSKLSGALPAISGASLTNLPIVSALSAGTGISISGGGEISVSSVALTTVHTASSQSAHLALTTQ